MSLIASFFLGTLALSSAAVLERFDPRIVNGEDAAPGEIPYQVSLQRKMIHDHFCGGAILNENYILTAAHCVSHKTADDIIVVAGTLNLLHPQSTHEVEKIIVHKNYKPSDSWRNDIALLRLRTPIAVNDQISFVPLPEPYESVSAFDVATISGWGRLKQNGVTPEKLQRVNIFIADQTYCKKMYRKKDIYETQVCAYDPKAKKGSCHGDSGGPLTVNGKLVGLVSWAKACALTDYPTVYTRVSHYINWIQENAV